MHFEFKQSKTSIDLILSDDHIVLNGQFLCSHDVEFDLKGNVYVSDRDRNGIQKFCPNGTHIEMGSQGQNMTGSSIIRILFPLINMITYMLLTEDSNSTEKFEILTQD